MSKLIIVTEKYDVNVRHHNIIVISKSKFNHEPIINLHHNINIITIRTSLFHYLYFKSRYNNLKVVYI